MQQTLEIIWKQMQAEAAANGVDLGNLGQQTKQYAAQRAAYLAVLVGEPGFDGAVKREEANIVAEATKNAVGGADQLDATVLGLLRGGLVALASVLSKT